MIYAQLYFYEVLFKVSTMSMGAYPLHTEIPGLSTKSSLPSTFYDSPSVSWLQGQNCPRELYSLCSNFKSTGGSLKRQLCRNLRSRTFEGGLKPKYPPWAPVRVPQRHKLPTTWISNKNIRIMSSHSNDILSWQFTGIAFTCCCNYDALIISIGTLRNFTESVSFVCSPHFIKLIVI